VASFADSANANAQAGVMIRQNTAGNAVEACTLLSATANAKKVYFNRRTVPGGSTTTDNVTAAAPYWIRINRAGNTVKSYTSADGIIWIPLGSSIT